MSQERYSRGFRTHRREVKTEFRKSNLDVRDYAVVREYLTEIIPNFADRYSRYDSSFAEWHGIRVKILDLPIDSNFIKESGTLTEEFQKKHDDRKNKSFDPNFWANVSPVLREITNIVSKSR